MASRELIIINRLGLHARAAAKFVTLASEFKAVVEVSRDSQRVNGKSIMGVMMLAASKGTQIVIHTEGADEDLAIEALAKLVNERFGEEV
ncbi:MAG TPA: HPr family phosphocarrier protein [Gammaproteobacteria bacterium]|nr:HPr family phosphocarrier protein [Gammaproteobacteria bacterium]